MNPFGLGDIFRTLPKRWALSLVLLWLISTVVLSTLLIQWLHMDFWFQHVGLVVASALFSIFVVSIVGMVLCVVWKGTWHVFRCWWTLPLLVAVVTAEVVVMYLYVSGRDDKASLMTSHGWFLRAIAPTIVLVTFGAIVTLDRWMSSGRHDGSGYKLPGEDG